MENRIRCEYSELVEIEKIVPHPKNPNEHPEDQIERLSKIINHQGQRSPLVVSKNTGFLIVGHGRLEAIKRLGWDKVAVDYQEFENEAQEYAHMTADNAIAEWARLDLKMINHDFTDFGPDLNLELLGLKNFEIEPLEKIDPADYDLLEDLNDSDISKGVKKAIMIEFDVDQYEDAFNLIKEARNKGIDVGAYLIQKLRQEFF